MVRNIQIKDAQDLKHICKESLVHETPSELLKRHAWLLPAVDKLGMAGKLGGAFATEQYTQACLSANSVILFGQKTNMTA